MDNKLNEYLKMAEKEMAERYGAKMTHENLKWATEIFKEAFKVGYDNAPIDAEDEKEIEELFSIELSKILTKEDDAKELTHFCMIGVKAGSNAGCINMLKDMTDGFEEWWSNL